MIATPVVVAGVAWRHHYQQVHASDLPSSDSAATDPAPTDSPSLPPAKSQEAATATQPNPALDLSNLLRLPGVEPLLNAEVARKLALTPSQMGAFERLNETTKEALQDLEKYWESVDRLELARRRNVLMEAARNEALQLLSDEQRQQWEAMTR